MTESISPPEASRAPRPVARRPGCRSGSRWRWSPGRGPAGRDDRRGPAGLVAQHPRGAGGPAAGQVLAVAHPVGGDIARVPDRQAVHVRCVAERVHDLERRASSGPPAGPG